MAKRSQRQSPLSQPARPPPRPCSSAAGGEGAVFPGRAWSSSEDEALRRTYTFGGLAAALEALPARSQHAITHRAAELGLKRKPHWAPREDAELECLWNEGLALVRIASRLGRSQDGVFHRAMVLGLRAGAPEGFEYLSRAAARTGYSSRYLVRILRAAGKKIRPSLAQPWGRGRHYHWLIVDELDVDEAVAEWEKAEPVNAAARRLGVGRNWLYARLLRAGFSPPTRRQGVSWRVTEEQLEAALGRQRRAA